MNALWAKARKPLAAGAAALKHRWQSPADLAGRVVSYGLFVFIFSRLWVTAFGGKGSVAGYTQNEMTWYFITAELLIFGLGNGAFRTLSQDIKSGQVAYTLARPRSYPAAALAEHLAGGLAVLGPCALAGLAVGALTSGSWPGPGLVQGAAVVVSFALAAVLGFFLQFVLALSAFWVEENAAFLWIHSKLALVFGTFLPLEFYPAAWRPWLEATPYAWLAYPPARLAAVWDPGQAWVLLGGQLLWTAGAGLAAVLLYEAGRRQTAVQGG